jgi:hypothetical protein
MPRLNPIWLAIPSFGVLIGVARADPQSCPSQVIPSLLPHTSTAASKQKPRTEKSVATGGDYNVQADNSEYDVTSDTAIFTGNVVIRQGERLLKADRVQIDTKKNVKGQGGVDYTDPIVHILGAGGDYSPTGGADFKSAQFELLQRPARGSAETMTLTPEGILNLQSVSFTTCPANEESWALVAKDITLDTRAKVGEAHDAKIEFEGIPILYLPRMSFPLGDERKSGFLFPVIGETSSSGLIVGAPYYWDIAANRDFTAEPIEYSRRGIDLGGDFRYLESGTHGELSWNYLPYDMEFDGSRSDVRLRNTTDLTDHLRFAVDAENVSDTQYFEDFSQGPEGTSTAFVGRTATLAYRDEHWRIDAQAQEYETIDDTLGEINRPYARAPAITASTDYSWGPGGLLHYGFDAEAVDFQRDLSNINCVANAIETAPKVSLSPCVNGWRTDIMPTVSLNLDGPGYFLRPAVSYRATQYDLSNTLPGEDKSPSRTVPLADVDAERVPFQLRGTGPDQRFQGLELQHRAAMGFPDLANHSDRHEHPVQAVPGGSHQSRLPLPTRLDPSGHPVRYHRHDRDLEPATDFSPLLTGGHLWLRAGGGLRSLADRRPLERLRAGDLFPPGQATVREFRRVRVRRVLLAGSFRVAPLHKQASRDDGKHVGGSSGHRRVAATSTHGARRCWIRDGCLPDRRDPGLRALGGELETTIQWPMRRSGLLRAAANRIGIANQPVALLLALVMAWAI